MTDQEKIEFIEKYIDDMDALEAAGEKEIETFREYVEEGVCKEWPEALKAKGYGSYGGNCAFSCDWQVSRDCLTRLAELTEDPFCYNTLGYIYYYGRCNDGVPEYDKAFQCYTIGHACGIFESTYKLADMFQYGRGTVVNSRAAYNLISQIYDDNYAIFEQGEFTGKFADVALRAGGLMENGVGVDQDYGVAYSYYLQAKYAISKRREAVHYYGDEKVEQKIDQALSRVRDKLPEDFFQSYYHMEHPGPIGDLLRTSLGIDVVIDQIDDKYYLEAKGYGNGDTASGLTLITVPALNYCKLVGETGLYIEEPQFEYGVEELPVKAYINGIHYEPETDMWELIYNDQVIIAFACQDFVFCENP